MGVNIPGELADLLNELGFTWPKSDETALVEVGGLWVDFADAVDRASVDARALIAELPAVNLGADLDSFLTTWDGDGSASATLDDGSAGTLVVGAGLYVCSAIVLALKINVIVQLTLLVIEICQAIVTASATAGLSLAEIPVFKRLTGIAIDFLVNEALGVVLG